MDKLNICIHWILLTIALNMLISLSRSSTVSISSTEEMGRWMASGRGTTAWTSKGSVVACCWTIRRNSLTSSFILSCPVRSCVIPATIIIKKYENLYLESRRHVKQEGHDGPYSLTWLNIKCSIRNVWICLSIFETGRVLQTA